MTAPFLPSSGPSPDPTALDTAVEAAARALWEDVFIWTDDDDLIPWASVDEPMVRSGMLGDARTVVEAIAPIIAAAERERIALLLEADADDEAQRPERSRDCCSRTIETWLREAAAIARAGTSRVDRG